MSPLARLWRNPFVATIILLGLVMLIIMALTGCDETHMPNDQIISETKKCRDAHMIPRTLRTMNGIIMGIQCAPPEDK